MTSASMKPQYGWRRTLYEIIFESDTLAGKVFDLILLVVILTSVAAVMLESVESIRARYGASLNVFDWVVTVLFTVEYVLRLLCVNRPLRYATSFFGIIDLLAVIPLYLGLVFPAGRVLVDIRILRLLRLFRILKLTRYMGEADALKRALVASRRKITVFLVAVLSLVVILGTLMYVVEGPENGYTSIPVSIYWAIVTLTTVGFGDITPKTAVGQALASLAMITGYAIIAVPTGIVTAEISRTRTREDGPEPLLEPVGQARACPRCLQGGHTADARFCKHCGAALGPHRAH